MPFWEVVLQLRPEAHHQVADRVHAVVVLLDRLLLASLDAFLVVFIEPELAPGVLLLRGDREHPEGEELLHPGDPQGDVVLCVPEPDAVAAAPDRSLDLLRQARSRRVDEDVEAVAAVLLVEIVQEGHEVLRVLAGALLCPGLSAAVIVLRQALQPVLGHVETVRPAAW